MYYRRKILFALLDAFGGEVQNLKLQNLLFLLSKQSEEKLFQFVPIKEGCHSFQANADLYTMQKYEQVVKIKDNWKKIDLKDYNSEIEQVDRNIISSLFIKYKNTTPIQLVKNIFINYPYYAIKSSIADEILNEEELKKVRKTIPVSNEKALYTSGFEGISVEEYLNKLINYDIKVLCDVRRNPLSMKFGFSKKPLSGFCSQVGIKYIHLPKLGVESDKRKELKTQADYDSLFDEYKNNTLSSNIADQQNIIDLINDEMRVAITCFEVDIRHCHRFHLADRLRKFNGREYKIIHI
jgi:uncharacterized protein (DUF488 family)